MKRSRLCAARATTWLKEQGSQDDGLV